MTTSQSGLSRFWAKHRTKIAAFAFSIAITAAIIVFRDQLLRLGNLGYLGVFLISVLGNATVILPVPSLAITFGSGTFLTPLLVGLVAGVGEPLGELTGYMAGYGGSAIIEDRKRFDQLKDWMERRGFLTLFVLAAIPNPLFDLAGITAGMLHFPVTKFLLACCWARPSKPSSWRSWARCSAACSFIRRPRFAAGIPTHKTKGRRL
jgi:membrane protein YqaA with SNARE-associated domain